MKSIPNESDVSCKGYGFSGGHRFNIHLQHTPHAQTLVSSKFYSTKEMNHCTVFHCKIVFFSISRFWVYRIEKMTPHFTKSLSGLELKLHFDIHVSFNISSNVHDSSTNFLKKKKTKVRKEDKKVGSYFCNLSKKKKNKISFKQFQKNGENFSFIPKTKEFRKAK